MIHYINLLKESVLFNILVSFTVIFFKTFYYSHPSLIFCFKNYLNFKPFLENDDLFFLVTWPELMTRQTSKHVAQQLSMWTCTGSISINMVPENETWTREHKTKGMCSSCAWCVIVNNYKYVSVTQASWYRNALKEKPLRQSLTGTDKDSNSWWYQCFI